MVVPSTGHVAVNTVFFDDGSFNINQNGYILKSLKQVDPEGLLTPVDTPSLPDFFVDDPTSTKIDVKWFQQLIGILVYALLTRHDIRKQVLFMAKHTSNPNEHDLAKVTRIFAYLKYSSNYGPTFNSTEGAKLYLYVNEI